ncbi:uncharacterized protein LOC143219236 isoform X2 [Lasioglossum baleicum]|uniref:uncharacterized protein LOC143219236 isoform X2 n=1 Tax=Lasioglossum baleicum TaxID=434251 RepID=UPI003FCEBC49
MKKMLRLPAIFVLIVSTFVGSSPVSQVEAPDKPEVAPTAAANVNAKIETTTILANNDSLIVAASVRPDENKKDSSSDTKIAVPPKAANSNSNSSETVPQHIAKPNETEKHKKCNSTKESDDMTNCYATSVDSGEVAEETTTQSAAGATTIAIAVTKKTEASETESQTPKPSPDKNKKKDDQGKDTKKKDDKEKDGKKNENVTIVLINATETTNQVSYDTAPAETSDVQNINGTGDGAKPVTPPATVNATATSNNTVVPLDNVANVEPAAVAVAKSADRNKSMPSGIIALVTAISFGVAIAIVYIGMIVWRRYRYGHRELLVNELEFDTNDLRHFEL